MTLDLLEPGHSGIIATIGGEGAAPAAAGYGADTEHQGDGAQGRADGRSD